MRYETLPRISIEQYQPNMLKLFVSLILSSGLLIFPLNTPYFYFRPDFVLLVTLYWIVRYPAHLGLYFAFIMGLLVDFCLNYTLGLHALAYSLGGYTALLMCSGNRTITSGLVRWSIASAGIVTTILSLALLNIIFGINRPLAVGLTILPSVLFWPLIYFTLKPRTLRQSAYDYRSL